MKKILLIILLIILYSNALNAQWHNRSCSVQDINTCSNEEFECMWNKASKIARGGAITTLVGTSLAATGGIMTGIGVAIDSEGVAWTGVFLGMTGIFIDIVGIPVWVTGTVRKKNLKKAPGYQELNLISLNIAPAFGLNEVNNSHYLGINISLSF